MSKTYWILDTDAGVDDCQAIILALTSPEIEVLAITTLAGNVSLPQVLKNTAETIRISGKSVPYYIGADRPLINKLVTAENIHGVDGLNNYWSGQSDENLPKPEQKSAVQAIIDLSKEYSNNINIVTIGPLTNLALAVAIDPDLPKRFNRVVLMGAAVHAKGNRSLVSEFNFWFDPEASYMVIERFPLVELVPWETCIAPEHQFSLDFLQEYKSSQSPAGVFINKITKIREGRSSVFFCDPITLCICIDPTIVLQSSRTECRVEINGNLTRGMTVVNWRLSEMQDVEKLNVVIVERFDVEKVKNLFLRSVQ